MDEIIRDLAIDYFKETPAGEKLQVALKTFEKVQETLFNLYESGNEKALIGLKIGTLLTFEVINRVEEGISPASLSSDEWKSIVCKVTDEAINGDPKDYSKYVFDTYAAYLNVSAIKLDGYTSEERLDAIKGLATELQKLGNQLDKDEIKEPDYVETCLWICLEGMIKCMSACLGSKFIRGEFADLIDGIGAFAFQYGRLKMYEKEQAILTAYLKGQETLDIELEMEYQAFLEELQAQTDEINNLIANAFDDDIRARIQGSIELARKVGVAEDEILKTIDDVDDFFM